MRPEGVRTGNITAGADDQKRIATPEQALRDGATWLVMGRPLRDAPDPVALARAIGAELQAVAATAQSFSP